MFKSVFSKFLTAFIVIIATCLSMLLLVVYGIVSNYAADVKIDSAMKVATAVRDYLEEEMSKGQEDPLGREDIDWILRLAATSTDQMLIILTDKEGHPIAQESNYAAPSIEDFELDAEALSLLQAGQALDRPEYFSAAIRSNQLTIAMPLMLENGMVGAVVVTSPNARWMGLLDVMSRTIVMASLWIMLAALIAVYFISERVSAPLREMRHAVKDFAGGLAHKNKMKIGTMFIGSVVLP